MNLRWPCKVRRLHTLIPNPSHSVPLSFDHPGCPCATHSPVMESWLPNHTVLLNQHSKHTLVKEVADFKNRPWLSRIPTTVIPALAWHWVGHAEGGELRVQARSFWPSHQSTATSCHVAQCIRHALTWICTASGNLQKKSSGSLRATALLWKRPFFQFPRFMLSRPLAIHSALHWMLPVGPLSTAQSRNSTPATQMPNRVEKLFCRQTPVHIF